MSQKEQAVFNLNMKKAVKGLDPSDKRLKDEHFAKNEDEQKKAARLVKKRNEALFALLEENPELTNDSDALEIAVKARFEVLNL